MLVEHSEEYELNDEEDMEFVRKVQKAKQYTLWRYGSGNMDTSEELGSFVPLALMQESRKAEVEEVNKEVNKKLGKALKRMKYQ